MQGRRVASANTDLAAVLDVVAEAERQQNDVDGFTSLLTDDVVLVNAVGRRVLGREAVRAAMAEALRTPLAGVQTRNEVVDARMLRPDVAVVSCIKHISGDGSPHAKDGSTATLTFVIVRDAGTWRIAVAHNTLVPS